MWHIQFFLLLYPRDLPGRLCCPVSGSQAVQAGVKVRCQAWALESGRGGGITLHQADEAQILSRRTKLGIIKDKLQSIRESSRDIQSMAIKYCNIPHFKIDHWPGI